MIYINSSIEPEDREEFEVLSISLMRKTEEINEIGEHKYIYGGWWKPRDKETVYVSGFIYNKREESILKLISKICLEIEGI